MPTIPGARHGAKIYRWMDTGDGKHNGGAGNARGGQHHDTGGDGWDRSGNNSYTGGKRGGGRGGNCDRGDRGGGRGTYGSGGGGCRGGGVVRGASGGRGGNETHNSDSHYYTTFATNKAKKEQDVASQSAITNLYKQQLTLLFFFEFKIQYDHFDYESWKKWMGELTENIQDFYGHYTDPRQRAQMVGLKSRRQLIQENNEKITEENYLLNIGDDEWLLDEKLDFTDNQSENESIVGSNRNVTKMEESDEDSSAHEPDELDEPEEPEDPKVGPQTPQERPVAPRKPDLSFDPFSIKKPLGPKSYDPCLFGKNKRDNYH